MLLEALPVAVAPTTIPAAVKTASPSRMAFPEILHKPIVSSFASLDIDMLTCFIALTPWGTVKLELTEAPAKLSSAAKDVVKLIAASLLLTTIAIVSFFLLYQALKANGPIFPSTLDPPKLPTTSLAASAPAPIRTIWSLLFLNADVRVLSPPWISPFKSDCAAVPASAASRNAKPAPVSIKFTLNDLRLRDDLRAFLLTAIFGVSP